MKTNDNKSTNETKHDELPPNMIKIPILDKFYEIDGEFYYQIKGDSTPRKWKDYNHMNFN